MLSKELHIDLDEIKDNWSLKKIISWSYALRLIHKEIENATHGTTRTSEKKNRYVFK